MPSPDKVEVSKNIAVPTTKKQTKYWQQSPRDPLSKPYDILCSNLIGQYQFT